MDPAQLFPVTTQYLAKILRNCAEA